MKLLLPEQPLQVLPGLAKEIGLNEAIFLQQLHYWLEKSVHTFEGRCWIYNTAAGWGEQFPWWAQSTIRRIIKSLKNSGLIDTTSRFNKKAYDKTLWFSINYQVVKTLETQIDTKASGQNEQTVQKASSQNDQTVTKASSQIEHIDVVKMNTPIPETTQRVKTPSKKQTAISVKKSKTPSTHAWFSRWWSFSFEVMTGSQYAYSKKAAGMIKNLINQLPIEELVERSCVFLTMPEHQRFPKGAPTLEGLANAINQLGGRCSTEIEDQCFAAGLLPDYGVKILDHQPWKNDSQPLLAAAVK